MKNNSQNVEYEETFVQNPILEGLNNNYNNGNASGNNNMNMNMCNPNNNMNMNMSNPNNNMNPMSMNNMNISNMNNMDNMMSMGNINPMSMNSMNNMNMINMNNMQNNNNMNPMSMNNMNRSNMSNMQNFSSMMTSPTYTQMGNSFQGRISQTLGFSLNEEQMNKMINEILIPYENKIKNLEEQLKEKDREISSLKLKLSLSRFPGN